MVIHIILGATRIKRTSGCRIIQIGITRGTDLLPNDLLRAERGTTPMSMPPVPRRMQRPKWMSIRVLGGVLLLVASIAIGAKTIGAASQTSPVWAVARDLAAGTVIVPEDLVVVDVNLGAHGAGYLDAATVVSEQVLNRPLSSGELLPARALDPISDARVVAVAVSGENLAPGVGHGSVADLYLVTGRAAVMGDGVSSRLVKSGVTIQSVIAPSSGGLSGAVSNRYQVALLLPPVEADTLVRQLPLGDPVIVAHAAVRSAEFAVG